MGGLDLTEAPLTQRLVLLGVADLATQGATPAHSHDVQRACREHVPAIDHDVVGTLTEADVVRALNTLVANEVITERRPEDASPVGKGRPVYELSADPSVVLDALSEPPFDEVVARLRR